MKQRREEVNAIKELSGSVKAPIQQLNQRNHPVGKQHIVSILPQPTESLYDLNHKVKHFAQVFEFILVTYLNPLADLDQNGNVLKLSQKV